MKERIYKGATRPPMALGIPLRVGVPVGGVGIGLSIWGGWFFGWMVCVSFAVLTLSALGTMRAITSRDDQRLLQYWMWLRLQLLHLNRRLWKCRSYSPVVYRGSENAWFQ